MYNIMKKSLLASMPPLLAGKLRGARARWLVRRYAPRTVEHKYGGLTLKVSITDPIAEGWYDHDWEELPEIAVLRAGRLRRGARVYDIGAHQGVVAMMLADAVREAGEVIAVEANKHNASIAERNREMNVMPQITVINGAISDRPGTVAFNQALNGQIDDGTGCWGRTEVQAFTIDGLADRFGSPDVVFLDVEGAEGLALAGASSTLARGADFFVEVHVGCGLEKLGCSVGRVLSYFPRDRYALLVRAEADKVFRLLDSEDSITRDRFFLIVR